MTLVPVLLLMLLMLRERRRCNNAIVGMSRISRSVVPVGSCDSHPRTDAVVIDLSTGHRLVADPKLRQETYAIGGAR